MNDVPPQGAPQEGIREASAASPLANTFLSHNPYPAPTAPTPPPPPSPPPQRHLLTRLVLPLVLFVGGIAAIAWVTQYTPNRAATPSDPGGPGPAKAPDAPITFERQFQGGPHPVTVARWAPDPPKQGPKKGERAEEVAEFPAEFEVLSAGRQDRGHYDFPFTNTSSAAAELGVVEMSCQCSVAKACVMDEAEWARYQKLVASADPLTRARQDPEDGFKWQPLAVMDFKGITVPTGGRGVFRLFWEVRKLEPEKFVALTTKVVSGPVGKPQDRQATGLGVSLRYVRPVSFHPDRIDVGVLAAKSSSLPARFVCWSATRQLKVGVKNTDPCFAFKAEPLNDKEREELMKEFRAAGAPARVRSAYRVEVVVHEEKDRKQLDLGPLRREAPLVIHGDGEQLDVPAPTVRGSVQGDIKVGAQEQNHVDLGNFKARRGTEVKVRLSAKAGVELEYESFTPAGLSLDVKLSKREEKSNAGGSLWDLRVRVPPDVVPGPLHEDSAIVLRIKGSGRRIRIPVVGTAGRG